jgi:predicted nuclease of predicted toxin-antitoxin system
MLGRRMTEAGFETFHLADRLSDEAADGDIWDLALRENLVVVTKDGDFQRRQATRHEKPSPQIVWLRCGNLATRATINLVLPWMPVVQRRLEAGAAMVEVR